MDADLERTIARIVNALSTLTEIVAGDKGVYVGGGSTDDDEPEDDWERFLVEHAELKGWISPAGFTIYGNPYEEHWNYYNPCGTRDVADLCAAVARAYEKNGRQPVSHREVGAALWGEPDAVSSGQFAGILYHAAKRGELVRVGETKPNRYAPTWTAKP